MVELNGMVRLVQRTPGKAVGIAEENQQYKDRLFNFVFGPEEHKDWTLSLYNAVNGTRYTDPGAVKITTVKEVMYLGMHNDMSPDT